jgi:hypothetical protein
VATRTIRVARAGRAALVVRLGPVGRRRLGRVRGTATLTLRLQATDRAGNRGTVTRRLRVRG